jgi:hypothetical protein
MITNVAFEINKGRMYAIITRDSITEGEAISIQPSADNDTYTKYLPNEGLVCKIDITPYCNSAITGKLKDVYDKRGGWASDNGVCVYPLVNNRGGYDIYYRNAKPIHPMPMSKLPSVQASENEGAYTLFIALLLADDSFGSVEFGDARVSVEPREQEDILFVRLQSTTPPTQLHISDLTNVEDYFYPVRVIPRGMNTRRLLWLNEMGGVDSWHFEYLRESNFASSSEVFYSTINGYTRTNRLSERAHIVETRELDDITAEVVAYIIASPEVYLIGEDDKLVPIDIITDECRTYSDTELSSIQIAYRLKERETL